MQKVVGSSPIIRSLSFSLSPKTPVNLGFDQLAQTEIGADPGRVRHFAEGVVELGCDYLLIYDHVGER